MIWTREKGIIRLEKPKGYVKSEANAINNAGVVVGMVDGPNGSPIGPNAFVYEKGRLRIINECGPAFTIATAINDAGQVAGVHRQGRCGGSRCRQGQTAALIIGGDRARQAGRRSTQFSSSLAVGPRHRVPQTVWSARLGSRRERWFRDRGPAL